MKTNLGTESCETGRVLACMSTALRTRFGLLSSLESSQDLLCSFRCQILLFIGIPVNMYHQSSFMEDRMEGNSRMRGKEENGLRT